MQQEIPYKLEAGNGNEIALAVLRFRKEAWSQKQAWSSPRAEKGLEPPRAGLRGKNSHPRRVRRKGAVATRTFRLVRAEQKTAKAFLRMEQIAAEARAEGSDLGEIKRRINAKAWSFLPWTEAALSGTPERRFSTLSTTPRRNVPPCSMPPRNGANGFPWKKGASCSSQRRSWKRPKSDRGFPGSCHKSAKDLRNLLCGAL